MNRLLCITLCFAYLLSEPVHVVAYDPNPRSAPYLHSKTFSLMGGTGGAKPLS